MLSTYKNILSLISLSSLCILSSCFLPQRKKHDTQLSSSTRNLSFGPAASEQQTSTLQASNETPQGTQQTTITIKHGQAIKSEEAFSAAIQKPCVVYFDANWCSPCDQIDPIFDAVAAMYKDDYTFIRVNVDQMRALATTTYHLTEVPAILFFNKGNEVKSVNRIIGSTTTKEDIVKAIKKAFE